MKATVENLKANRLTIISELKEIFGADRLKSNMHSLLNIVEFAEKYYPNKTLDRCIDELVELSTDSRRKTSKTAELLSSLAENRGEYYDSKSKTFKKY